jgi:septal ring factor EnvC (AmiA/AmiB activator)
MEMLMSVERELAEHGVEIKHIQDDIDRMMTDIDEIKRSLADINRTLSEAKGGWKTMMAVAGFASAVTGVLSFIVYYFTGK